MRQRTVNQNRRKRHSDDRLIPSGSGAPSVVVGAELRLIGLDCSYTDCIISCARQLTSLLVVVTYKYSWLKSTDVYCQTGPDLIPSQRDGGDKEGDPGDGRQWTGRPGYPDCRPARSQAGRDLDIPEQQGCQPSEVMKLY